MRTVKLLAIVVVAFLSSCATVWTPQELEVINEAKLSRMRVTTIANDSDSLLLRRVCEPLTEKHIASAEFGRLVASMMETVRDPENEGVGIAAPQVGLSRRLVVVQRFDKEGEPFEVYVNPEIVAYGEVWAEGGEGCLSVPDRYESISRATSVEITYRDAVTFEPRSEVVEGFTAVIFQHEIDHLDGILYIDKVE